MITIFMRPSVKKFLVNRYHIDNPYGAAYKKSIIVGNSLFANMANRLFPKLERNKKHGKLFNETI